MIISGPVAAFAGTATLFLGCAVLGILLLTFSWFFTDVRLVEKMNVPTDGGLVTQPAAADKTGS